MKQIPEASSGGSGLPLDDAILATGTVKQFTQDGLFLNLKPLTVSIEDFSQSAANWLP